MTRQRISLFSSMMVLLLLALFLLALGYPSGAAAYIARSGGGTTTTSGMARSQPAGSPAAPPQPAPEPALQPPQQPAPAPAPSPVFHSTGSYGIARSGSSGGFTTPYQPAPQPPSQPAPAPQPPAQPAPQPPQLPGTGPVTLNPQEQLLFNLVNHERAARGLAPLQLHPGLTGLARLKSQDMINNNYFAHQSPVYGSAGDMARSAGISFTLLAENIGVGGNITTIFNAFMDSSGHRNKIIGPRYTHTGIGIIHQPGRGYLVTQIFMEPR